MSVPDLHSSLSQESEYVYEPEDEDEVTPVVSSSRQSTSAVTSSFVYDDLFIVQGITIPPGQNYVVFDSELMKQTMIQEMRFKINDVSDLLVTFLSVDLFILILDSQSIPPYAAQALLAYRDWNQEKLTSEYLADPNQLIEQAGVQFLVQGIELLESVADVPADVLCEICYESVHDPSYPSVALGCRHFFHVVCWEGYLNSKVQEGVTRVTCMAHGCNASVPPRLFEIALTGDALARYHR